MPTESMARTANVWLPSLRPLYSTGETQEAKAAPSRPHSKVAPDGLLAEKMNVASLLSVVAGGPESIIVSIASSMVQR